MSFHRSSDGLAARRLRAAVCWRSPPSSSCASSAAAPDSGSPRACLVTAALGGGRRRDGPTAYEGVAGWLELARSAAWYGFILHLYRRTVTARRQLTQTFVTMGLLALLLVGGLPLIDAARLSARTPLSGRPAPPSGSASRSATCCCWKISISTRRPRRAGTSTCSASRLGGVVPVRPVALRRRAAVPPRLAPPCSQAARPVTALAAPLIAIAAVRNRRWAVDIHVSRDVVFHSATLVAVRHLPARPRRDRRDLPPRRRRVGHGRRSVADVRRRPGRRGRRHLRLRPLADPGDPGGDTSSATATITARSGCAASRR